MCPNCLQRIVITTTWYEVKIHFGLDTNATTKVCSWQCVLEWFADQSWFFLIEAATLIPAAIDNAIPRRRGFVNATFVALLAKSKSDDFEVPLFAMSSS